MTEVPRLQRKNATWSSTLLRILLIAGGGVAILLPAWLPNRTSVPIESGTVEMLQAVLLMASAVVIIGASAHAGYFRPACRVLSMVLIAAVVGEVEDFASAILGWQLPETLIISLILATALITALKHRRVMKDFFSKLGHHAGSGFIAAALLINYVFNVVVGSRAFWQATLGNEFSPVIPRICRSYLELLACYLIFIGTLGLSITLARRKEPS